MLLVRLPIERPLAGDRDVLAFEGVDERRVVHQLDAFESCQDERITRRILREAQRRASLQMQVDAAVQTQRIGGVIAGRNDYPPAARPRACLDGLLDGRIRAGEKVALREAGRDDAREESGDARPGIAASSGNAGCQRQPGAGGDDVANKCAAAED